jgi:hypothetical protein
MKCIAVQVERAVIADTTSKMADIVVPPQGNDPRRLTTPEKCLVAVFLNAIDDLWKDEFNAIINETQIVDGQPRDLSGDSIANAITKQIKYTYHGRPELRQAAIILSGNSAAVTIPLSLRGAVRQDINIVAKVSLSGFKGNTITNAGAVALLGHEIQHVLQIIRVDSNPGKGNGTGDVFLLSYLGDYTERLAVTQDSQAAYESIRYEIEAHTVENALSKVFLSQDNSDRFQRVCDKYTDDNALSLNKNDADAKILAERFKKLYEAEVNAAKAKFKIP